MNLYYLLAKEHQRLAQSSRVSMMKVPRGRRVWHGVQIADGGVLKLKGATQCHPFRTRCESPGWYVSATDGNPEVTVRFFIDGRTVRKTKFIASPEAFEPIVVPWPEEPFDEVLDLHLECHGGAIFVGCNFDMDRKPLIARCTGTGVELGPGANPLLLPADDRRVSYVEQKSPAEWSRLFGDQYKKGFDPALEPFYITGDAHEIPAEAGSLDFIFSSHVFEHLVNPLGHLRIWSQLLRKGGEVVMFVPDFIGSKDFLADPSTMEEICREYSENRFKPSFPHYEKYARARVRSHKAARKWMDAGHSVHMHYYSNDNMSRLLEFAIAQGWFAKFTLLHSRNAREFYVILAK